jgi:transcriptional regulator with XRE-family HTH domain
MLRRRRESLRPADVGLPDRPRRRTPGLRREEVAAMANISPTYYAYLEQGRPVNPSTQVIAALAASLQMTPLESRHLVELVHGIPEATSAAVEILDPRVADLVNRLEPDPAYVAGRTWDVLTANPAARQWWVDWPSLPPEDRNMLVFMFLHPQSRQRFADWETEARALLARFRVAYSRHSGDAQFEALLHRLLTESADAHRWWPQHELAPIGPGRKTMIHPELGTTTFEHVVFTVADAPEQKLVIFRAQ